MRQQPLVPTESWAGLTSSLATSGWQRHRLLGDAISLATANASTSDDLRPARHHLVRSREQPSRWYDFGHAISPSR